MKKCINKLVCYCYINGYVSENQVPWLRYSIEKRLSTIIGFTPFVFLAFLLSDFWCAIFFIISFCVLRSRINGFHAKTLIGCLSISLATELLFFMVIYPLLRPIIALAIWGACLAILLLWAPYNHPNMHYSMNEVLALKKAYTAQSQEAYLKKYEAFTERYEKIAKELERLQAERTARTQQDKKIALFIRTFKKLPDTMTDWNDTIWTVMVEKAIVHKDGRVTFVFKNGTEIKVGA